MPRPLPFRPDPAPPPHGLAPGDGQAAHDAARTAQFARLQQVEHDSEEPRSHGAELADQMTDHLRALIRHTIGPVPWVQAAYPCRVVSIEDRTRRRCTVQLLESGGIIHNVQADPALPVVGGQYAVRRTVRLNPAATRGAPEEVHWTLKVPSSQYLYWFDIRRHAGAHTLLRTAWPLADPPAADTIEEVLQWPTARTGGGLYTGTTLLGIDGEGRIFASRSGHTGDVRVGFTEVTTAPLEEALPRAAPATTVLPMRSATGALTLVPARTNLAATQVLALASAPGQPGILVGMLLRISLLLNPTLHTYDATSNDTLDYFLSADRGASWTLRLSLPNQPAHWQAVIGEPSIQALYSNWSYVPAGRMFAWIPATSAEAAQLGAPVGQVAWLQGMVNYQGALVGLNSHFGGFGVPYLIGGMAPSGALAVWATGVNGFGTSSQLFLAGAGGDDSAYRVARIATGAPPTWVRSTHGPDGPWEPFPTATGNPAIEMVGLDRSFTQGLVAYEDNDTGQFLGLAATTDGAIWTPLTPAQQAAFGPTLVPDTAVRGWIVDG